MTLLFVYGTLKKSQPNHGCLLEPAHGQACFLGSASTLDPHPLVISGPFNVPFLVNAPGEGVRVSGELYSVDQPMLRFLDAFEGVPTAYQRVPLHLQVHEEAGGWTPPAGRQVEAQAYVTSPQLPGWRSLPAHHSYDAYGDHGLLYVSREART